MFFYISIRKKYHSTHFYKPDRVRLQKLQNYLSEPVALGTVKRISSLHTTSFYKTQKMNELAENLSINDKFMLWVGRFFFHGNDFKNHFCCTFVLL